MYRVASSELHNTKWLILNMVITGEWESKQDFFFSEK